MFCFYLLQRRREQEIVEGWLHGRKLKNYIEVGFWRQGCQRLRYWSVFSVARSHRLDPNLIVYLNDFPIITCLEWQRTEQVRCSVSMRKTNPNHVSQFWFSASFKDKTLGPSSFCPISGLLWKFSHHILFTLWRHRKSAHICLQCPCLWAMC